MIESKVPAAELARVIGNALPFASGDRTVPVIVSVRLEADGETLTAVATDRYTLGADTVPMDSEPFAFLLSRDDAQRLHKVLKDAGSVDNVTLTVDGDTLTVNTGPTVLSFTAQYGEFPKWRSLLPAEDTVEPTDSVALNPEFLARFAKVAPDSGRKRKGVGAVPMRITFYGKRRVLVRVGETFYGLIMPVRV